MLKGPGSEAGGWSLDEYRGAYASQYRKFYNTLGLASHMSELDFLNMLSRSLKAACTRDARKWREDSLGTCEKWHHARFDDDEIYQKVRDVAAGEAAFKAF